MSEEKARIEAMMQGRVEDCLRVTARLVRPSIPDLEKTGGCSGVLIDRGLKRATLLATRHSFGNPGEWALELDAPAECQGLMLPLPEEHRRELNASLDIAWWDINYEPAIRSMETDSALEGLSISLPLLPAKVARPATGTWFAFAAYNRGESYPPIPRLGRIRGFERKPAYEIAMEFGGVVVKNGMYRFNLARKHQGDAYYFGASGAPIFDDAGNLVSMVVSGCEKEDCVYGFPLADYAAQLDLIVMA